MRKTLTATLAVAFILTLTGCGSGGSSPSQGDSPKDPAPVAEVQSVATPDVIGLTVAAARDAVEAVGLTLTTVSGADADIVNSQLPTAGTEYPVGTPVIVTSEPAAPVAPAMTPNQEAAYDSASTYAEYMPGWSRQGLIDQLLYEQFSVEDASFAVDALGLDYNEQAAASAKSYMDTLGGFSYWDLVDQLLYEDFDQAQAEYGASSTGLTP